jgi:hypothetical protein
MKLVETIKSLFAQLNKYTQAAKDIEKKISETLNNKEEEDDEEEEEEEEKPRAPKAKKKPAKKKKKHEFK